MVTPDFEHTRIRLLFVAANSMKGGDGADRGSQGEAYKAVFGNTDKLIETKDALAEKAMLVRFAVALCSRASLAS